MPRSVVLSLDPVPIPKPEDPLPVPEDPMPDPDVPTPGPKLAGARA